MDVKLGTIVRRCFPRHRAIEFRGFLDRVERSVPSQVYGPADGAESNATIRYSTSIRFSIGRMHRDVCGYTLILPPRLRASRALHPDAIASVLMLRLNQIVHSE